MRNMGIRDFRRDGVAGRRVVRDHTWFAALAESREEDHRSPDPLSEMEFKLPPGDPLPARGLPVVGSAR
jgi:hypothetical protein